MRQCSTYRVAKTVDEGVIPQNILTEMSKSFTMKPKLKKISRDNCEAENLLTQERKLITRQAPGASRIYAKVCIFCEKVGKYKTAREAESLLINVVTSEVMAV